jgi:hypothetical protein
VNLPYNGKSLNLSISKPPKTPNPSQIAAKVIFDLPHLVTESEAEEHAKRITASLKASEAAGIDEDVDPYYDEEDYGEQSDDQQYEDDTVEE